MYVVTVWGKCNGSQNILRYSLLKFVYKNGSTFTLATGLVRTLNSRYDILNDLNLLMRTSWYACRYIRSVYIKTKLLPRCVELNPGCFAPFLIFCTELFNINIVAKHMMNFGIFFVNIIIIFCHKIFLNAKFIILNTETETHLSVNIDYLAQIKLEYL